MSRISIQKSKGYHVVIIIVGQLSMYVGIPRAKCESTEMHGSWKSAEWSRDVSIVVRELREDERSGCAGCGPKG